GTGDDTGQFSQTGLVGRRARAHGRADPVGPFTTLRGPLPLATVITSPSTSAPVASAKSVVQHSACGDSTTLSSAISGLSAGSGSTSNTSRPAPAIVPSCRAVTRAGSSTTAPRAML